MLLTMVFMNTTYIKHLGLEALMEESLTSLQCIVHTLVGFSCLLHGILLSTALLCTKKLPPQETCLSDLGSRNALQ